MTKEIEIRVATGTDRPQVLDFIRTHYYEEEPLTVAHPQHGHTADDEAFSMSHIEGGGCLVAIDGAVESVVGVLIAGAIEPGDADLMLASAERSQRKWADIQRLLAHVERKADVLARFGRDTALHCHALAVHGDYRGLRIGQRLFERWIARAKELGFQLVSVDCTSVHSMRVAEACGLRCVSTVTYDEWHGLCGERVFEPKSPNTEIRTYAREV